MAEVGEKVEEGVGRVAGFVNEYVVQDPSGTYLIDTSMNARGKPVRKAFERAGSSFSTVSSILLTHYHLDHMGGAAAVHGASHAPVACHGADAPFVDGRQRQPIPWIMRLFARTRPCPVARSLSGGEMIGPFRVIFAPGHTPGEVAFYHPEKKLLFAGDVVRESRGSLTLPAPKYAHDIRQAVESLKVLRALDIEVLLPGHGNPVRKDVASRLDDLIARAPEEFLRAGK